MLLHPTRIITLLLLLSNRPHQLQSRSRKL
jgi:hypothetical protein